MVCLNKTIKERSYIKPEFSFKHKYQETKEIKRLAVVAKTYEQLAGED